MDHLLGTYLSDICRECANLPETTFSITGLTKCKLFSKFLLSIITPYSLFDLIIMR